MGPCCLPGHTLVVLDPQLMLVIDAFPRGWPWTCRSVRCWGKSEATVQPKDLGSTNRDFCTTGFLFGIARREGFFLVRQHAATLTYTLVERGRIGDGWKPAGSSSRRSATDDAGEVVPATSDRGLGQADTRWRHRAPPADQCAGQARRAELVIGIAGVGRSRPHSPRWRGVNGEINALGYPKAALFSFCMALVAYNVLSTVRGVRSVHGDKGREALRLLLGGRDPDATAGLDEGDLEGRMGCVSSCDHN